jgi:hypothetical protein
MLSSAFRGPIFRFSLYFSLLFGNLIWRLVRIRLYPQQHIQLVALKLFGVSFCFSVVIPKWILRLPLARIARTRQPIQIADMRADGGACTAAQREIDAAARTEPPINPEAWQSWRRRRPANLEV